MAVIATVYAVLIGLDGGLGSAAFGLFFATASVGFVFIAGWMRKHDKKRTDLFPPGPRTTPNRPSQRPLSAAARQSGLDHAAIVH